MGRSLWVIIVSAGIILGVIAGILEVVPYVGGFITVILAVLSAATVGVPQVIAVIVLYVVLVNVESHVLAPLLYGKALGLPPVAILLALLAGVELLGILGALLAIPLTVIIWAIGEEFAPQRRTQKDFHSQLDDCGQIQWRSFCAHYGPNYATPARLLSSPDPNGRGAFSASKAGGGSVRSCISPATSA